MEGRETVPAVSRTESREQNPRCRIVAVTSGKGGVGKTNMVVNTAIRLSGRNRKVLVVDMDLGLANVDLLFDADIRYTLANVVSGEKSLSDIIVRTPEGIDVIGGVSGIESIANLDEDRRTRILSELMSIEYMYDLIIIDTGAGISNNVMNFVRAADDIIIVTLPEQPSVLDAYVMLKLLSKTGHANGVSVAVNMCSDSGEGIMVFERLSGTARKRLGAEIKYLGAIPFDTSVRASIRRRKPFIVNHPKSPAARGLAKICDHEMWGAAGRSGTPARKRSFFRRIFNAF